MLAGLAPLSLRPRAAVRFLLVVGPGIFLGVAVAEEAALLALPPEHAKGRILLVEAALTISLALGLWGLFLCLAAARSGDRDGAGAER